MHRRCFLVVGPLQVFVGNGVDAFKAFDLHPDQVLDAAEHGQFSPAFFHIREFQHGGALEVAAVRYQRVVGVQFVLDAVGFEDFLDAQHLLDLVLDRKAVLEVEMEVRSDRYAPVLFVFDHVRAKTSALYGIGFERHQVASGEWVHHDD